MNSEVDIEGKKVRNRILIRGGILTLLFIITIVCIMCEHLYFIPISIVLAIALCIYGPYFIRQNEINEGIKKIIFILSFLPFVILVIFCAKTAITGISYSFLGNSVEERGFGFFLFILFFFSICFSTAVPILPVCVIYQNSYLIYRKELKNDK